MFAFLLGVALAKVATVSAGDHPATKIIALMEKLQVQTKQEGEAEAAEFAKFGYWCSEMTKEKEGVIKTADGAIGQAKAQILALTEDISQLDGEIAELADSISRSESSKSKATNERNAANAIYLDHKSDIESTATAIGDAIAALESSRPALIQRAAVQKALAFVDVYAPAEGSKKVHAFLQSRQTGPVESAEADQFENRAGTVVTANFRGDVVIETLKKMKVEFEDKLTALNKYEQSEASSHSLADGAKQNELNAATRSKDAKTELSGAKGQDLAEAQANLEAAENERSSAKTILDETTSTCRTRTDEWNERSKRRQGEIDAMQEAVEVMTKVTGVRSPESKGVATTYSFLQKFDDPRAKIVGLLRKAGNSKGTAALRKLADKIASMRQTPGKGTFDQIKNMIQKMIFHLMSEQKDEDDHKNWCDKELETTTLMQEDKDALKEKMEADIASLTAEIDSLTQSTTDLRQEIETTDSSIEEETASRAAAKAENSATIKDAQAAQSAVAKAVQVLTDFYKSTGGVPKEEWEAFVQMRAIRRSTPEAPEAELWAGPYEGTGGGSGVIGLLENIGSDFATMEAEAKSDETTQQDEFDQWLTAAQISKSEMEKDEEMKLSRKDRLSEKLQARDADATHNQKELDATNKYWADLQRACVNGDSSYGDRKAARLQETTALREAQGILEDAFASP